MSSSEDEEVQFALIGALGKLKRRQDQAGWDLQFLLWLAHKAGVPIEAKWQSLNS